MFYSRSLLFIFTCILSGLAFSSADKTKTERAGDYTAYLLPISALALTFTEESNEGSWQFLKSYASSALSIEIIKAAVDKKRPNYRFSQFNQDGNSHPSGHAGAAFTGASFIYTRYGKTLGLPAYAVAGFTAYSRVYAEKHFWEDVLAGGSLAVLSTLYFVTPANPNLAFLPMAKDDTLGIHIIASNDLFTKRQSNKPLKGKDLRYRFDFMPSYSRFSSDDLKSNASLFEFKDAENRLNTSSVSWSAALDQTSKASFIWHPYEIRARGFFNAQDDQVRYHSNNFTFKWTKNIPLIPKVITRVGASFIAQYSQTEVYKSPTQRATIYERKEWNVYPAAVLTLGYQFNSQWSAVFEGAVADNGSGDIKYTSSKINYQFNKVWGVGAAYNAYQRTQNNAKTFKHIDFNSLAMSISYSF